MASVGGFVGYVNYREPYLGKALDYLTGAGFRGAGRETLEIVMPDSGVAGELVEKGKRRLSRLAAEFFGHPLEIVVCRRPAPASELKLFPIESSKAWNQILFFLPAAAGGCQDVSGNAIAALAIGKKEYRVLSESFPALKRTAEILGLLNDLQADFFQVTELAAMVDRVVPRARAVRGIVHLVSLCENERRFLALDYACMRIKEYGTPGHEGPLEVRTLLGRLHAVFPGQYCAGLSLLHALRQ